MADLTLGWRTCESGHTLKRSCGGIIKQSLETWFDSCHAGWMLGMPSEPLKGNRQLIFDGVFPQLHGPPTTTFTCSTDHCNDNPSFLYQQSTKLWLRGLNKDGCGHQQSLYKPSSVTDGFSATFRVVGAPQPPPTRPPFLPYGPTSIKVDCYQG